MLPVSLKESGKSRADLWALATIAAVEHGIETNNMVCDGTYENNPDSQCNAQIGTDQCRVRRYTYKICRKHSHYFVFCSLRSRRELSSKLEEEIVPSLETNHTKQLRKKVIQMLLEVEK